MSIIQKIDHFLFKFSYSSKAKFMLMVCFIVATIIFVLFLHVQAPFIQLIDQQLAGTKENQALHKLLKKFISLQISKDQKETASQASIESLQALILDAQKKRTLLIKKIPLQNQDFFEQSSLYFSLLSKLSERLKIGSEGESFQTLISYLIQITTHLIYLTDQASQLNTSIDSAVYQLLQTSLDPLLQIQLQIPQLLTKLHTSSNIESQNSTTASFITYFSLNGYEALEKTLSNVQVALQENLLLNRLSSKKTTLLLLENFKNSLKKLIEQLQSSNLKQDLTLIDQMAKKALEDTFLLNEDLFNQVNSLLNSQLNLLLARNKTGWNCIIFGIGIVVLMYVTKVIRRPLMSLKNATEKLASGDLLVRIPITSHDEVGQMSQAFNDMARFFEEMMHHTIQISQKLASSSCAIMLTAKELEANVIKQETVIHQITATTKDISYTVNDFANSLKEMNKTAHITSQLASLGRVSITEMETIMQTMMEGAKTIVSTLSSLQKNVKNINSIISAIVKIADQSNLLFINTALRAQRTGLKGVGFSVVADKIKYLADQTAVTTLHIERSVQEIIDTVSDVVEEVNLFSTKTLTQVDDATKIGEHLKNLIGSTQEQLLIFEHVNQGMQDQTTGVSLIHEALLHQTKSSEETTHSIRKLYKEIEYIHHATNHILHLTKTFKTKESEESLHSTNAQ